MRYFVLFFLLCFGNLVIFGQDQWINYTNNHLISDVEEGNGELWIGSSGGLCKMDSMNYELTFYNRGNSDIPSNMVQDLLLHPDGTLWMSTSRGICTMKDGKISQVEDVTPGVLRLTPDGFIAVSAFDSIYIQQEDDTFVSIEYPHYVAGIGGFEFASDGSIYINIINYYAESYIARYQNGEWTYLFYEYEYNLGMTLDKDGNVWMAKLDGIYQYQEDQWIRIFDKVFEGSIQNIRFDRDDNLLINVSNNRQQQLWKWDGSVLLKVEVDVDNCTSCRFIDVSRNSSKYYVVDYIGGLYVIENDVIEEPRAVTQSPLHYNYVLATYPNGHGQYIVFGNRIQFKSKNLWKDIMKPEGLESNIRYHDYANDALWISDGQRLWRYKNDRWSEIELPSVSSEIENMTVGNNGDVWIQYGTTLARYKNDKWSRYTTAHHKITNSIIKDMEVDEANGDLWVTTFQGVRHFDGLIWTRSDHSSLNHFFELDVYDGKAYTISNNKIYIFTTDGNLDSLELPSLRKVDGFISKIFFDHDDETLYVSGIDFLMSYKDDQWNVFDLQNSNLINGFLQHLMVDQYNNIWLSGNNAGLEVLNENGIVLDVKDFSTSYKDSNHNVFRIYPTKVRQHTINIESRNTGRYRLQFYDIKGSIVHEDDVELSPVASSYNLPRNLGKHIIVRLSNDEFSESHQFFIINE